MSNGEIPMRRLVLMLVAGSALTAVLGGLARLGLGTAWGDARAVDHGPLFVVGVFQTVIALERAVALGRPLAWAAPWLGVATGMAMLFGFRELAPPLAVAAAAALVAVNAAIVRRQSAAFTWMMLLGSFLLLVANLAWLLGTPIHGLVLSWMGFFVLTILAERLELSRLAPKPPYATAALWLASATLVGALALAFHGRPLAAPLLGLTFLALAVWEVRFDVARLMLRARGLPRYAAIGVLLGSFWLLLSGLLLAVRGFPPAGPVYDAIVHGVLVGFVLSMVFAHAPIILPAVTRIALPFDRALYAPLAILHVGLALRMVGNLAPNALLRQLGGLSTGAALLALVIAALWARRLVRTRARTTSSTPEPGGSPTPVRFPP